MESKGLLVCVTCTMRTMEGKPRVLLTTKSQKMKHSRLCSRVRALLFRMARRRPNRVFLFHLGPAHCGDQRVVGGFSGKNCTGARHRGRPRPCQPLAQGILYIEQRLRYPKVAIEVRALGHKSAKDKVTREGGQRFPVAVQLSHSRGVTRCLRG